MGANSFWCHWSCDGKLANVVLAILHSCVRVGAAAHRAVVFYRIKACPEKLQLSAWFIHLRIGTIPIF